MITEKLKPTEMKRLRSRLEQYGTITDCAQKTGIHRTTIARILKMGECTVVVANKLRNWLNDGNHDNKNTTEETTTESVLVIEGE
jgi:predicted DNA-binding protein (UPF0251 family)